jgi:hypothetical protein
VREKGVVEQGAGQPEEEEEVEEAGLQVQAAPPEP